MTLSDAATVLKVSLSENAVIYKLLTKESIHWQAVEVSSPRAAYELSVLTHFAKGSAAPRGRVSLPHDPRTGEEKILVFADGKNAEVAKKLGAAYVGGEELIDSVRPIL